MVVLRNRRPGYRASGKGRAAVAKKRKTRAKCRRTAAAAAAGPRDTIIVQLLEVLRTINYGAPGPGELPGDTRSGPQGPQRVETPFHTSYYP